MVAQDHFTLGKAQDVAPVKQKTPSQVSGSKMSVQAVVHAINAKEPVYATVKKPSVAPKPKATKDTKGILKDTSSTISVNTQAIQTNDAENNTKIESTTDKSSEAIVAEIPQSSNSKSVLARAPPALESMFSSNKQSPTELDRRNSEPKVNVQSDIKKDDETASMQSDSEHKSTSSISDQDKNSNIPATPPPAPPLPPPLPPTSKSPITTKPQNANSNSDTSTPLYVINRDHEATTSVPTSSSVTPPPILTSPHSKL